VDSIGRVGVIVCSICCIASFVGSYDCI
jgi:hypothetical protein